MAAMFCSPNIRTTHPAKPFVKMGALFHEIRGDLKRYGIVAPNSNYALGT